MLSLSSASAVSMRRIASHNAPASHLWHQLRTKKKAAAKGRPVTNQSLVDLSSFESSMETAFQSLEKSYARLRSSQPSPDILDEVPVEAYGSRMPLKNLAQVSMRDGRNLFVTVFDDAVVAKVEKAVRGAGLNMNPVSEGKSCLRIPISKLSQETRSAMKETAKKEAEAAKISTRMARRSAMEHLRSVKEGMPKDDIIRVEKNIQQMTDYWVGLISQTQDHKTSAIMKSTEGPTAKKR